MYHLANTLQQGYRNR